MLYHFVVFDEKWFGLIGYSECLVMRIYYALPYFDSPQLYILGIVLPVSDNVSYSLGIYNEVVSDTETFFLIGSFVYFSRILF